MQHLIDAGSFLQRDLSLKVPLLCITMVSVQRDHHSKVQRLQPDLRLEVQHLMMLYICGVSLPFSFVILHSNSKKLKLSLVNTKGRSYTQLDSRKRVTGILDRVTSRHIGSSTSIKGELQRQNKLISSRRPFKILQNETKIIKIG